MEWRFYPDNMSVPDVYIRQFNEREHELTITRSILFTKLCSHLPRLMAVHIFSALWTSDIVIISVMVTTSNNVYS